MQSSVRTAIKWTKYFQSRLWAKNSKLRTVRQCATSSPSTWPEDDSIWFEIKIQTKRCRQRPWGPSPPFPSTLHSSSSSLWPGHIIFNELRKLHNYHWDGKIWNFCLFVNSREKTVSLKFVTTESRTFDFLASIKTETFLGSSLTLTPNMSNFRAMKNSHKCIFLSLEKKIEKKSFQETFIPSWVNKHFEDKTFYFDNLVNW